MYERTGARQFLQEVSKLFDVWLFTAAKKEYADAILKQLDSKGEIFTKRLYRENCVSDENGRVLKNLEDIPATSMVSMENVVLVDDDEGNLSLN